MEKVIPGEYSKVENRMLVRDGEDFLEISILERETIGSQVAGDTRFAVRVRVSSLDTLFMGESCCWVELRSLAGFAEQLRLLEERRQGSAVLESISPGELRLEIRSTDRAGHMAAIGQVGQWCYSGVGGPHWSAVTFGLPFCPSELPKLLREFSDLTRVPHTP